MQTSGASFGVQTNRFGFAITGTSELGTVVQACTDLAHPAWSPLGTITLAGGSSYFSDDRWANYPARFYRLSGTTFGGRPTAPWKPVVQMSDASFGVLTNQYGFNINWASGMVVVVEACTNQANPAWSPLQTNSLGSDSVYFSDAQWTNHPTRFCRLRSPINR